MKMGMRQNNTIKRAGRNKKIRDYYEAHPGIPKRAIARMFHLSHEMIRQILKGDSKQNTSEA